MVRGRLAGSLALPKNGKDVEIMVKSISALTVLLSLAAFCSAAEQRPAGNPEKVIQLKADLGQLVELKIVLSAGYWQENAVKGKACEGDEVAALMVNTAKYFQPSSNMEQALELLRARKIIWNDYWRDNAVPGKKCNGEYVANLIHAAARDLKALALLKKYSVPPGVVLSPIPSAFSPLQVSAGFDTFNYVIGTQTFGPSYQFTQKTKLVETAEAILGMGSTVIKFELAKRYAKPAHGNVDVESPAVDSLMTLARDEPSHRQVLDMPFAYYVLWAHTFSAGGWNRKLTKDALDKEYGEMYEFVCYLLKTYSGSGKIFYLGHWEGDGWLRGTVAPENDAKVTPEAVQSMADWLNVRQKAVDDAKRETPHKGVQVWHYTEVNHVWLAMEGRPALVNEVLPKTTVDLVSYSSYDTASEPEKLKAALNYIESKLSPKSELSGRRVFIGEYGFPADKNTPEKQDAMSRQVMKAGIEWGCPLVLYWEMYNNEVEEGKQRGFWMIDDKGVKQPVYDTHQQFYKWAGKFVSGSIAKTGRLPSNDEFRKEAAGFMDRLPLCAGAVK